MDSASGQFVLFGLAAALLSNLHRSLTWRSTGLMSVSIVFLGLLAPDPVTLLPLLGFLLLGYGALTMLVRGESRHMAWSIVGVTFAYIWLKKYSFLPQAAFLRFPYFTLGLSYILFRVLHLLIEAGDGNERRIGLGAYLLYTLNFTTLVSGPIQRYDEFARDQFASTPIRLGPRVVGLQLERIVRGFFKVNVVAMLLYAMHEDALAQMSTLLPLDYRLRFAFRLTLIYPLFLYANFSGYIDIVVALARLMRLRLPENFDRPFSAGSVLEFWSRWHMTLSNWLKTYVYNPLLLALMRRSPWVALQPFLGLLAFFVTFFLIGVWHGRTSEFLVFGLLCGAGVSGNKLWQLAAARAMGRKGYQALARNGVYNALGRGLNYVWFSFTLFWFWGNWHDIHKAFAGLSPGYWLGVWMAAWLFSTAALACWEWLRAWLLSYRTPEGPVLTSRYVRVVFATALGLVAFVVTALLHQPAPDIVYKAF